MLSRFAKYLRDNLADSIILGDLSSNSDIVLFLENVTLDCQGKAEL